MRHELWKAVQVFLWAALQWLPGSIYFRFFIHTILKIMFLAKASTDPKKNVSSTKSSHLILVDMHSSVKVSLTRQRTLVKLTDWSRKPKQRLTYLLDTSTCTEWSMTRSTGQSGLIRLGSPPSLLTASRIAAKSTTAGTPLKNKKVCLFLLTASIKLMAWLKVVAWPLFHLGSCDLTYTTVQ